MNPFYLAARAIDLGWDAFKVGKSAKLGEKFADLGRRLRGADVSGGARAIAVGASVQASRAAGKIAGKTAGWWQASGKAATGRLGSGAMAVGGQVGSYLRHDPIGQRVAVGAISAGAGYYTSDPNASAAERFGRAAGFGLLGAYGTARFQSPKFGKNVSGMFKNIGSSHRGNFAGRMKAAGIRAGRAAGVPAQWGYKQSMAIGAVYGMMSDQTSVLEGAVGGAALHFGAKKMGAAWNNERQAAVRDAYKTKGIGAAFRTAPVFRTALYGGAMLGAYNSIGSGGGTMGVIGGTAKGALAGAAIGGGTKAMMAAPTTTLALGLGGLTFAGSALEATGTLAQAGAPGFDTMNADGDLASSLHRMRHG